MAIDDPWSEIGRNGERLVGRRIDEQHALDLYWVRRSDGAPGLLLRDVVTESVPARLPNLRGIALETEADADTSEVRIFLRTAEDREVFLTLCRDVIHYSSQEPTAAAATRRVFRRMDHWHSLMSKARTSIMEGHEIRGLMGELHVLERLIASLGIETALPAWVAPDEHPQDFALADKIVEVKTRSAGSKHEVQISSLHQLDSAHLPLFLLVVELVHATAGDGFSLNQICDRLLAVARHSSAHQEDVLETALLKRGYVRHKAYDEYSYVVTGEQAYEVNELFPRISRALVAPAITGARYTLDLCQLGGFAAPSSFIFQI
nr:PD-(D/E)XK motif protein [Luteibacter sp. UNCMF331Sha3.1]